jgi:hypothetical protein
MAIRRLLLLVLSLCLILGSSVAWSAPTFKDKQEAQKLVNTGIKHDKSEAWQEAREAFEAAIALNDTPKARYYLAKALVNLGLLMEAREHAQLTADNNRAGWWDRKHAKELLKNIEERMPHLTVNVPADFSGVVRLGDTTLSSSDYGQRRERNPGSVSIRAESEGFLPFEKTVVLGNGTDEVVAIELEAEPQEATATEETVEVSTSDGSTRKTLGYVSLVVGGVGLVAGTAFGLMARSTRDDLRSSCANDVCSESDRDAYDKGKMQANLSTAGFVVGGVGIGLGAVLLLTGGSDQEAAASTEAATIRPYVGPTGAGLYGSF